MKTFLETITPTKAQEYLDLGGINPRKLDKNHVKRLAYAMSRGEFLPHHQGIAFNPAGKMRDGQHRLSAIIQSGITVEMNVSYDVPDESFLVVDLGKRKTLSEVLVTSTQIVAISTLHHSFTEGIHNPPTPQRVRDIAVWMDPLYQRIMHMTHKTVRHLTTASVRYGVALHLMEGEPLAAEYALTQYRAFVRSDYGAQSASIQMLSRNINDARSIWRTTKHRSATFYHVLVAYRMFDINTQHINTRVPPSAYTDTARERLQLIARNYERRTHRP